jgi:acetyl esterase/lipase
MGILAEWTEPTTKSIDRAILYLHGGGYVIGSTTTHRGLIARISLASHARVLAINYRLAPEHPFPAGLLDALSTYLWLLEQGINPQYLALGGDSAGGGLSLAVCLTLRALHVPLPAALFLISPWTDLTFSGDSVTSRADRDPVLAITDDWLENAYAGGYPISHPLISPLFADLSGLPPMLIQVGTEEILFDDSARLSERVIQSGGNATLEIWEGMWHVFQAFAPYVPEAVKAIDQIGSYLQNKIPAKRSA